jgi:hypothetical protein
MRDEQMIDGFEARFFGSNFVDAFSIAFAWVAAIDEKGFSRRSDDKSSSAPFDIDKKDAKLGSKSARG